MKRLNPTIHFSLNQAAYWANFSGVIAYASVFLLSLGFTNTQIGLVIAIGSGTAAIVQPLLGGLADRSKNCIHHKIITIISLAAILLAGLLMLPGKTFWFTAIMYGLLVFSVHVLTPITYSIGLFFIKKGVNINFGIARSAGSLSYALVSALLGRLTAVYSVNVIMIVTIALYLILIISTVTFHFKGISEDNETAALFETGAKEKGFFTKNRRFLFVIIGVICVFISHNLINSYIFQIISYHGYGSKELGNSLLICAISELPILFLYSKISKRFNSGSMLKVSGVFFAVKSLAILMSTSILQIYLAMPIQLLGYGLFSGASVYYVNHTIEEKDRVRGQAFMTSVAPIGSVIGSIAGGWLLDRYSVPGLMIASTAVALVGAVIMIVSAEKGRKE